MSDVFQTYIISGFPGVGKTYYTSPSSRVGALDSDSSSFSWIEEDGKKVRNPDFPRNYIEHIRSKIGEHFNIFVSTHEQVRKGLIEMEIPFNLIYPSKDMKSLYLRRYEERGSSPEFIQMMKHSFDRFIDEIDAIDSPFCNRIKVYDQTVTTVLSELHRHLVHASQPVDNACSYLKRVCLSVEVVEKPLKQEIVMPKFRKKPVVIEAYQYAGGSAEPGFPKEWLTEPYSIAPDGSHLFIDTLEGVMKCDKGDFIIKGVKGEFYPCKPDIFSATYEEV